MIIVHVFVCCLFTVSSLQITKYCTCSALAISLDIFSGIISRLLYLLTLSLELSLAQVHKKKQAPQLPRGGGGGGGGEATATTGLVM